MTDQEDFGEENSVEKAKNKNIKYDIIYNSLILKSYFYIYTCIYIYM